MIRTFLIKLNMAMSLMGLTIDADTSPFWAVLLMVAWFIASVLLVRLAVRRGWINLDKTPAPGAHEDK